MIMYILAEQTSWKVECVYLLDMYILFLMYILEDRQCNLSWKALQLPLWRPEAGRGNLRQIP